MTDLVVVVPSRGRPEQARALAVAFEATCTADTKLLFAVDDDDPHEREYSGDLNVLVQFTHAMNEALNYAAGWVLEEFKPFAVGFMGDDHRPRTVGWDQQYLAALRELGTGIVYGDDLMQGRSLPTQCAMTADIIRALGYMAPPTLVHMYLDNFWLTLGTQAGCIRYLPDVVVEHRHPLAGKSAWDAGYARVNSSAMYARDEAAWGAYVASGGLAADVEKVRALRGAHV